MNIKTKTALAGSLVGVLALSACGGSSDASSEGDSSGDQIDLVGFSVLEASNEEQFANFQGTDEGADASLLPSYGASGDQSRAVEAGKAADIVHFSLEPDMQRVVDSGAVSADWNTGPTKGIWTQSVVVFVVRPGNPEGIEDWDDLTKEGVEVITPNPASSGSAKWNILAAIGQAGDEKAGEAYLKDLLGNTVALPESARDATTLFDSGTGDVLLSYENEAILARQNGAESEYVLPDTTLLIENPGAVTVDASETAKAFSEYLLTDEGQTTYAKYGFRPLGDVKATDVEGANDPSNPFPEPGTLLTVGDYFNGWGEANTLYFDEEKGIVTELLSETGQG